MSAVLLIPGLALTAVALACVISAAYLAAKGRNAAGSDFLTSGLVLGAAAVVSFALGLWAGVSS